jgi:hypothetical protein
MSRRPHWQGPRSLAASRNPRVRRAVSTGRRNAPAVPEADEWVRAQARRSLPPEDPPKEIVTAREAEAVSFFLWGDGVPLMRALWKVGTAQALNAMLWGVLAEHPPWTTIGRLMRPTRNGNPVSKSHVSRHLHQAARKLGRTVPGLREAAVRGLQMELAWRVLHGDQTALPEGATGLQHFFELLRAHSRVNDIPPAQRGYKGPSRIPLTGTDAA